MGCLMTNSDEDHQNKGKGYTHYDGDDCVGKDPVEKQSPLYEILNNLKCIECDGSGGVQISEDEAQQCQFCYEIRYPFIEQALTKINKLYILRETVEEAIGVLEPVETGEGVSDLRVNSGVRNDFREEIRQKPEEEL